MTPYFSTRYKLHFKFFFLDNRTKLYLNFYLEFLADSELNDTKPEELGLSGRKEKNLIILTHCNNPFCTLLKKLKYRLIK